nr:hypothetical protein [Cytophagales bacterium]
MKKVMWADKTTKPSLKSEYFIQPNMIAACLLIAISLIFLRISHLPFGLWGLPNVAFSFQSAL